MVVRAHPSGSDDFPVYQAVFLVEESGAHTLTAEDLLRANYTLGLGKLVSTDGHIAYIVEFVGGDSETVAEARACAVSVGMSFRDAYRQTGSL